MSIVLVYGCSYIYFWFRDDVFPLAAYFTAQLFELVLAQNLNVLENVKYIINTEIID